MLSREQWNISKFAQDFSELLTVFRTLELCLHLDIVKCIVRSEFFGTGGHNAIGEGLGDMLALSSGSCTGDRTGCIPCT